MKIALLGTSMNHFHYVLLRYLRDIGIDAYLLLPNFETHFQPSSDTYNDQYFEYIINYSWSFNDINISNIDYYYQLLSKFQFFITNGHGPAILSKIGLKSDIFIPLGGDLANIPFERKRPNKLKGWIKYFISLGELYTSVAINQKSGIENAKYIILEYTNENYEKILEKFSTLGKRLMISPPILYLPQYYESHHTKYKSPILAKLRLLKEDGYCLLIQHCRQSWVCPNNSFSHKGNDDLLYGIKMFVTSFPEQRFKLILLEYGPDIAATKALIKNLNIENYIIWLPIMERKYLMGVLGECELGIAETKHSFFMYGVVSEYLALGIPFISNCSNLEPPYNHLQASNKIEIYRCISAFFSNREKYTKDSLSNKNWFHKYTMNSVNTIINLIKQ